MAFETNIINSVITIIFGIVALISVFMVHNISRERGEDYRWAYILIGIALMGAGVGVRILEFVFNSEVVTLMRLLAYLAAAITFLGVFHKPAKKNEIFDG